jgi:hypothetical protein
VCDLVFLAEEIRQAISADLLPLYQQKVSCYRQKVGIQVPLEELALHDREKLLYKYVTQSEGVDLAYEMFVRLLTAGHQIRKVSGFDQLNLRQLFFISYVNVSPSTSSVQGPAPNLIRFHSESTTGLLSLHRRRSVQLTLSSFDQLFSPKLPAFRVRLQLSRPFCRVASEHVITRFSVLLQFVLIHSKELHVLSHKSLTKCTSFTEFIVHFIHVPKSLVDSSITIGRHRNRYKRKMQFLLHLFIILIITF